jgi:tetratricopeptide (TPR) repeat protein
LVTAGLALAPAAIVGLALAYRSDGLTNVTASLEAASHEGHRLALVLVALAVVNGLVAVGLAATQRFSFGPAARTAYAAVLVLALVAALTSVFVRYGSPPTLAERAYDTLATPTSSGSQDLNQRLFTLSSRARVLTWRAAWADFEENRLLGSGAGTYELYWAAHRTSPVKVRDAHSLYLETLAELGPMGLILLVGGLVTPVAAAVKARTRSLVPAATAAYVAFLVHAGVDWDWEMSGLTITGLLCGVALLVAARRGNVEPFSLRARVALIAVAVALAAAAFVGAMGNSQIAASRDAASSGQWTEAADHARNAMTWMPWSSEPWQLAGEAQLALGQRELARSTLSTAIDKDPRDWELWLALSRASNGVERREAAAQAVRLNPLGVELAGLRRLLGMDEATP